VTPKRIGILAATAVLAGAGLLIGLYISLFLTREPATVLAKTVAARRAQLTLQTVAAIGHGPTPDWVSYYIRNDRGRWEHSTIFHLPAHAQVTVTIYQYDTGTGLRNPLWSQPRGVVGNTMYVDGKPYKSLDPDEASHTFTVPDLGVSVPLKGVADDAPNQCAVAPCDPSKAHTTIRFTFRTGKPGTYRWQCFVPCAAGFILGFGGPMQTIGYMDGELVVA
jgi:hypothetical protein